MSNNSETEPKIDNEEATILPSHARVVVIGGGAVGCSVLYHLALHGWKDVVLLEKNELTSGSTWHAAGNCPNFVGSWTMMKMQSYSTELYRKLGKLVDYPMNYHVTGAIRLAHSRQRMEEFEHVCSMGRQMGVEFEMLTNSQIKELHPYIETHDLEGGQWDALDGDIDPAQLTQALARGAKNEGAKIVRFCPVTGVERHNDEWVITTPKGKINCEFVVNAAGYRAAEVGKFFGRNVPCVSIAHQYLITETIPELEALSHKVPLVRDPDSSYYLRQEKNGLLLGPYEFKCRAHWVTDGDPMPDDFSFQLYNDDLERLEWYIDDACKRVPILGSVGITRVVNGPIPYAPDGLPLVGQMPGVPNAFEACVFTFGIVQAGGAGKLLAEIIVEGESETDPWAVDPRRFTDHVDQKYTLAKAIETYSHEYAMHFPQIQWPAGRPAKTSPIYKKLISAGAVMGSYGGWERADWFTSNESMKKPAVSYDRQHWFSNVGEECRHVSNECGIIDLTGFSRFELTGEGSSQWLENLITGNLPKVGKTSLIYFASPKGKVLTEMTATRIEEDHYWLLTGAGAYWHDRDWLNFNLPNKSKISISDNTKEVCTLLLTGPKSEDLISNLSEEKMDKDNFPWLSHKLCSLNGNKCRILKVSYAGEKGYEIHAPNDNFANIYDQIILEGKKHNLIHFGMLALDSMRLEKNYRSWKSDLTSDYSILESGLRKWINFNKENFVGKERLTKEHSVGLTKEFVTMTVEDPEDNHPFGEAVYLSPVFSNNKYIGPVVSSGFGHRVNQSIAMAIVDKTLVDSKSELHIEVLGRKRKVKIVEQSLYDPENLRLKS